VRREWVPGETRKHTIQSDTAKAHRQSGACDSALGQLHVAADSGLGARCTARIAEATLLRVFDALRTHLKGFNETRYALHSVVVPQSPS